MRKIIFLIFLLSTLYFALVIANPELKPQPLVTSDKCLHGKFIHHSVGGRKSPGDSVGWTTYDWQRGGGQQGQRIAVDDTGQIHVNWMFCSGEYPGNPRLISWNFRFVGGMWYGQTDAAPSVSGACQVDVMVADPAAAKRTMNTWHYRRNAYISIDQGSGWGSWPGDTGSPHIDDHIWPVACVASNNNIIMATQDMGGNWVHLYLTTDEGKTWTNLANLDSSVTYGFLVRASRNSGSQKVVLAWNKSIALENPGFIISQMAQDIWYMLSTDNGLTWGRPTNVTNYMPPSQMVHGDSSPWACYDVNPVFDNNDNLHIAWGANLGYMLNDTIYFGDHSKIFHWDEVSDTITVVSSPSIYYDEPGGWWLDVSAGWRQHTEDWGLPTDNAQLVVDPDGYLFCLWRGNDDTTDYSAEGWFNSEICASYSTDNGVTWSDYVNLTNTRSPGAGPGDCFDEDCMTAFPRVINDSIFITYIEDKDAGRAAVQGAGSWTNNPVRVWVFHKGVILGTEEEETYRPEHAKPSLKVYPNPFSNMTDIRYQMRDMGNAELKIYDVNGRLVRQFDHKTIGLSDHIFWYGRDDQSGRKLPAGVYFIQAEFGDERVMEKVVKIR